MSFAFRRLIWRHLERAFNEPLRLIHQTPAFRCASQHLRFIVGASAYCAALRYALRSSLPFTSNIDDSDVKLPKRLKRFYAFSSIEYNGVVYMTPRDFLDSIILDVPRERVFRRVITKGQLRSMLNDTPPLRKGSAKMFRKLGDNGLISYAEYLFLITLLTKSQYAFSIAFLMFDEDENMKIDKKEFLMICSLLIASHLNAKGDQYNKEFLQSCSLADELDLPTLQKLTHHYSLSELVDGELHDAFSNLNDNSPKDTTIMVHLFKRSGSGSLSLDQLQLFQNNLQLEIIEMEFNKFARGKSEISSVDFARLVLRYSILHKSDHAHYIQRIYERSGFEEKGITLQQFEQFSMFLNNLEEFAKAVRLYTAADISVSRSEFIRAVKCSTGFELDEHLVDVLYKIFDANGNDELSYSEFIAIMNDRLHRGFRSYAGHYATFGWLPFKKCMIHELSIFQ